MLAREGRATSLISARLPVDEVARHSSAAFNYFQSIEEEAEAFVQLLDPAMICSRAERMAEARIRHRRAHAPVATMPNWRRRYDRHSQRLFISERLSPFDQLREEAMEGASSACRWRSRRTQGAEAIER